jgi:hypothetical protein
MSRYISIAGNEDPALESFYVGELLRVLAAKSILSPVLVDAGGARGPKAAMRLQDARESSWPRGVRRIAGSDAPVARAESLAGLRDAWARKGGESAEKRAFFVLPSAEGRARAAAAVGRVLFLARKSPGTASSLYALIGDAAKASPKPLAIAIAVSGCERIEEAAEYFRALAEELKGLPRADESAELTFAGPLAFDRERMAAALAVGSTYGEVYPGDALAGRLAFIGRKIAAMLEDGDGEDPIEAIAALPRQEG